MMTAEQARERFPDAFASPETYEMIEIIVFNGEAELYERDGQLMYCDFNLGGEDTPVSKWHYNPDYGLRYTE